MRADRDRLRTILEADKEELNETSKAAALADFKRVAEEYFEVCGGYSFAVRKDGRGEEVVLSFRISRVKNCTGLR